MDFHSLARRDLQALCKLNAIPANMTNVAMADALTSLDIVEGIEEFMNRSPERKAVTAAKVPRTGRRTATQSKPIGNASESVQPMARSTRRTTRRTISDEIMDESKTPAIHSSKKTVELAKTESEGIEDVENKGVTDTPSLATYSRRNQVAKSSVKEVNTTQRVYSTRRSARLTENNALEEKEVNINSLVSELSKVDLEDGLDNKSLSEVLQESVEKSDNEVNAVQEDSTKSLMIENKKEGEVVEEKVDELGEKSEQHDEPQLVADSLVIEDEDNKGYFYVPSSSTNVLESPIDNEDSRNQTKSDEAMPESGREVKEDNTQEIVVDELKEKSEQCFNTLDESIVHEVNANNVMIQDEDSKELSAGGENLEPVVISTEELSAGGDSDLAKEHMTYSDESKDEILENDDPEENADQTEDKMDSEKSGGDSDLVEEHMTYSDESKDEILGNDDPEENADQTEDEMDSDESRDEILDNDDPEGNADQTEDEMDSEKSFLNEVEPSTGGSELFHSVTCFEGSKADFLNNYPKDTKAPSVKELNCVLDDKENINRNGLKFEPTEEEAKKNELHKKSLRELSKMLKLKLQITNDTAEETGKVMKERPALQKLEDNCQR